MKRMNLNRPKVKMIGGPWLLLFMGLLSLLGVVFTIFTGRVRRRKPRPGDRSFSISLLNGTWYELAHAIPQGAAERIGVVFSFHPRDDMQARLTRTSHTPGSRNGNREVMEGYLVAQNPARPWELLLKRDIEADQAVRVLYADPAERVILFGWDRDEHMILLHAHPEMDERRYAALMLELKKLGVAVSRLRPTPRVIA